MWSSFWKQARSIFVLQSNTLTVVYAKNPISSYAGQSVKINSKKDLIDFIKRFAISGTWSIVIDTKNNKTYRVMKKGKQTMQIPIQSLNSKHNKKFPFDFDETMYAYYLEEEDIDDIELVLANGEPFILNDGNSRIAEKKRDKKHKDKEEVKGMNVTAKIDKKKTKTATFTIIKDPMYSACLFKSVGGSTYEYTCSHCELRLIK